MAARPRQGCAHHVQNPPHDNHQQDDYGVHDALLQAIASICNCQQPLSADAVTVVRKTYDARPKHRAFMYVLISHTPILCCTDMTRVLLLCTVFLYCAPFFSTVHRFFLLCTVFFPQLYPPPRYVTDIDAQALKAAGAPRLRPRPGQCERVCAENPPVSHTALGALPKAPMHGAPHVPSRATEPVVVVGRYLCMYCVCICGCVWGMCVIGSVAHCLQRARQPMHSSAPAYALHAPTFPSLCACIYILV